MNVSRNLRRKPLQIINKLTEDYRFHSNEVSLGKLYELLGMEPTPLQVAMIDLWDNRIEDFSEVNIAASRRYGKTLSAAVLAVRELLIINSSTIVISKSSKSVSVIFNEILRLLRVLGVKPTKINSNNYTLQVNDSHFRATPFKTMSTLLGLKSSLQIYDESGTYSYKEEADLVLKPMLNDYSTYPNTNMMVGKILRISSPRSIGSDMYYTYIDGLNGKPKALAKGDIYINAKGICSLNYDIYSSPLVSPHLIESLKQSTEPDVWKTEYLSLFVHLDAISAFTQFNKEKNLFDLEELTSKIGGTSLASLGFNFTNIEEAPRLQGFIGLDLGFRDSSSIIVGTVIDNNIYILDTFASPYLTTKEFAEEIQKMISKWSTGTLALDFDEGAIYIDKTAAMAAADLNLIYDIPTLPGFNKVRDGISLMNVGFQNNKLRISKDLTELIDEIETLAYKEAVIGGLSKNSGDPFIRIKGKGHHDRVHAMRYMVTSIMKYWGYASEASELDY